MNTQRSMPPVPPARGSFPLDHDGECKDAARAYLACVRAEAAHNNCRDLSKEYLQCRMERNLMTKEDLNSLGFAKDNVVMPAPESNDVQTEIIAGLSTAKKAKGAMFGIALPFSGYEAPKPIGGIGGHSGGMR